ncbi:MAG: sugar ABC transporter [Prochlorococcaceae cyanobacterium]
MRAVLELAGLFAGRGLSKTRTWSVSLISGIHPPGSPGLGRTGDLVPGYDAPATTPGSRRQRLRERLKAPLAPILRIPLPVLLAAAVVALAGVYFFSIGRNRYQVNSSFIVRLPQAPAGTTGTLLGTTLAGPTMLGSLEDGRFLAVYLTSPEVMKRVFFQLKPQETWGRQPGDPLTGLAANANADQQLAFFRRQVMVVPQDLTGVINLTTIGLKPDASYRLNQLLLKEAEDFLNRSNQTISLNQQQFFEQEVERSRERLDKANNALNSFKNQYGEVDLSGAAAATSGFITQLESKLVDLKVQEASLKRQFKDPTTPEVAYITDQVRELERQIQEERELLVTPEGRDLNRILAEGSKLETEVLLATESLKAAINSADSNRQRVQQQLKFLVRLADPQLPAQQFYDWRWKGFLGVLGGLVVLWGIGSFSLGVVNRR